MIDIIRFDDKVKLQVTQLKKRGCEDNYLLFFMLFIGRLKKNLVSTHSIEHSQVPDMQNVNKTDF